MIGNREGFACLRFSDPLKGDGRQVGGSFIGIAVVPITEDDVSIVMIGEREGLWLSLGKKYTDYSIQP